ncbi:hypothetical protein ACTWPT_26945 [Nonomuraea sp. 3N208]|uniref:hypothetical protein n=1 Tax=Nonomuraea sp. 3N208 TaxID=3457421 RepID=UPI003FCF9AC4
MADEAADVVAAGIQLAGCLPEGVQTKVCTVSESDFGVPDHLLPVIPDELLRGALVEGWQIDIPPVLVRLPDGGATSPFGAMAG